MFTHLIEPKRMRKFIIYHLDDYLWLIQSNIKPRMHLVDGVFFCLADKTSYWQLSSWSHLNDTDSLMTSILLKFNHAGHLGHSSDSLTLFPELYFLLPNDNKYFPFGCIELVIWINFQSKIRLQKKQNTNFSNVKL